MKEFNNAQEAFEYYYNLLDNEGIISDNTKMLYNVGFNILNPLDNEINTPYRKWNKSYADIEWEWYLSGNRSVEEIKKIAKIWDKMHSGDNIVNSNYGYQWMRNNQIGYVINELKRNKNSRRAAISIYDGKEHEDYKYDTPCTMSLVFYIENNKLRMSVYMRSNDLWWGYSNDQYCFSKIQEMIAKELGLEVGIYYHHATNLHIYEKFYNKNT